MLLLRSLACAFALLARLLLVRGVKDLMLGKTAGASGSFLCFVDIVCSLKFMRDGASIKFLGDEILAGVLW